MPGMATASAFSHHPPGTEFAGFRRSLL